MTTRSGRRYQNLGPKVKVMSVDLSQMLQALIEDRKACEGTWPRNQSVERKNNRVTSGMKKARKRD